MKYAPPTFAVIRPVILHAHWEGWDNLTCSMGQVHSGLLPLGGPPESPSSPGEPLWGAPLRCWAPLHGAFSFVWCWCGLSKHRFSGICSVSEPCQAGDPHLNQALKTCTVFCGDRQVTRWWQSRAMMPTGRGAQELWESRMTLNGGCGLASSSVSGA